MPEQPVPGRMELHLVDAVPVPVMGAQPGRIPVRLLTPPPSLRGTGGPAEPDQAGPRLFEQLRREVPVHGLGEREVAEKTS